MSYYKSILCSLTILVITTWAQVDQSDYYTLLSTQQTILRDRAKVLNGRVGSNMYVEIGAQGKVNNNVECGSNIFLRSNSHVYANVVAGGTIIKQAGAVVDVDELSHHTVMIPPVPAVGPFTPGKSDIEVGNDQSRSLTPDNYNNVTVRARARLYLSSGTYVFRTLTIEQDAIVYFGVGTKYPAILNALNVNISSRVKFDLQGNSDLWLVRINTTQTTAFRVETDSRIKGIITAPNALAQICDRSTLDGAIHAKNIEVAADATVNGINVDTDGDALPDAWEIMGYDANNDGIIDVDLPAMGANPLHKDIFVEADWMEGSGNDLSPPAGALDDVIQSFASANLTNPDGVDGVTLHVDLSNSVPFDDDLKPAWDEFDSIKKTNFNPDRQKTHHYCIIAWGYNSGTSSGYSRGIPGSDFIVSLSTYNSNRTMFAGTFMHELGHNLHLRHGGPDDSRYKPNHLSIMNYSFQFPLIPHQGANRLDYCRFNIESLDETNVNESVGLNIVTGHGTDALLAGYGTAITQHDWSMSIFDNCGGPIDWNINGNTTEPPYEMDLNPSIPEGIWILEGDFNEWEHVTYTGDGIIGLGDTYLLPGTVPANGNSFALECIPVPDN